MGKVLNNAQLVAGEEEVDIFALLRDTNRQPRTSNYEESDNADTASDEIADVDEYDEGDDDNYDDSDEVVDVEEVDDDSDYDVDDNYGEPEVEDVDDYDDSDEVVDVEEVDDEDDDYDGDYAEGDDITDVEEVDEDDDYREGNDEVDVIDVDDGYDDDDYDEGEPEVEDVDDEEGYDNDEDDVDYEDTQQEDSQPSTISIEELRGMVNTAQHKNSSEKVVNKMSENVQQSTSNIKPNEVEVSENRKQQLLNTQFVKLYLGGRTKKQAKETLVGIFTLFSALIEYLKWYELSDLQADIQNVEQEIANRDNAIDTYTDDTEILKCVRERKELKTYKQEVQQLIKYMSVATDNDLYDIIEEVINALKEG